MIINRKTSYYFVGNDSMTAFIPGIALNEKFYFSLVKPILEKKFPALRYSVARIGYGSDVLEYDTKRSMDHDWGPRLELFLKKEDYQKYKEEIYLTLANELPKIFLGFSINFSDVSENGVRVMKPVKDNEAVNHRIEIHTIKAFFKELVGMNPYNELSEIEWLQIPEQRLLAITSGAVYHDGLNELAKIRERFSYYPETVWHYILQKQWSILAEEQAFPGRAAEIEDEVGLQIMINRQLKKVMKLCFLIEKKYAPYNKWFTKAFSELPIGTKLLPLFKRIYSAKKWSQKEKYLVQIYSLVANRFNELKIIEKVEVRIGNYFDRPYLTINFKDFIQKLHEKIPAESPLKIIEIGAINQITDEAYILENPELVQEIYDKLK
jgi:hypothetical protein